MPFLIVCALSGVALGTDLALPGALLAGVIAANGDRGQAEGAYFGWWNFATKLNLALAAGLALPLLALFGYTPGTRDPQALQALTVAYCLLPCVLKLAGGALYVLVIRHSPPQIPTQTVSPFLRTPHETTPSAHRRGRRRARPDGCAGPHISDYAAEKPVLDLRHYFNGTLDAYGVFTDRSGKVVKRFTVVMHCSWTGDNGVLDEDFVYSDGTKQKRIWRLKRFADGRYTGTADDVVGEALGQARAMPSTGGTPWHCPSTARSRTSSSTTGCT